MHKPEVEKVQFTTLLGVFFMLMMAVFAAEVTVMQLYSELFIPLAPLPRALLDASSLVAIISLPLWFFVFRPALREKIKQGADYRLVTILLFAKVLAGIYLIQFAIMLVLPDLMSFLPMQLESLVDGALTTLFSAPLFWWLLYRLDLRYRLEPLADFLHAPMTLYILLLFMIFLGDMLQEIIFHQFDLQITVIHFQLFDALASLLLIAPLLLFLVVRPLRRLAQSEKARTNAIYDQVVDGIVKIDANGTIESFNLAAQNIFGLRPEQVIGTSASLLLDQGQLDFSALLPQLANDGDAKSLRFHELTAKHQDSTVLTLDGSISKIQLAASPDEYLLLLRDISGRKAVEDALLATDASFREIFDQTEDAIIFFDPDSGRITDVNATTVNLYGFNKRELQTQGLQAFCSAEGTKQLAGMLREIDRCGSITLDQLENHRKDGQSLVASIHCKMMTLQGKPVVYCTVRDISERVRLEEDAREIQAKLIQTNKMTSLGLLVSGVAHEINNPNNYILSNAQLLAKIWKDAQIVLQQYHREHGDFMIGGMPFSSLGEHTPELLHGITDGSRRISAIVNNLKHFARQDSGQAAAAVDVNQVASSAVSILHHQLAEHTDSFFVDLADDLPPVTGSGQQLGQVVINLLMNACQALPDKSRAIWLETGYDPQHQLVRISVRDQGGGLSEEIKDKILEPFFSTRLDSGGTGLGLSICQSIIKDHGGQIVFFSQPEKGTTFTVTLPVAASE